MTENDKQVKELLHNVIKDVQDRLIPQAGKITEQDIFKALLTETNKVGGTILDIPMKPGIYVAIHMTRSIIKAMVGSKHIQITDPSALYTEAMEILIAELNRILLAQEGQQQDCATCPEKEECDKEEQNEILAGEALWTKRSVVH